MRKPPATPVSPAALRVIETVDPPTPPPHLRPKTAEWFSSVVADYQLEEHHLKLLVLCGEAWDRNMAAREAIEQHGLTYTDRFGQPHARPEIAVCRDAAILYSRCLRELDLDLSQPAETPRPVALKSNRRL